MKHFIIVALLGCTFCFTRVQAQSKKEKRKSDVESYQQAPSSRDPGSSSTAARKSVKKSGGSNFNSQAMEDYVKLKKENAK
ncbi:MAG: hypothetical protein ACR2MX_02880, partial [Cyclobacteriaceae bacterium]